MPGSHAPCHTHQPVYQAHLEEQGRLAAQRAAHEEQTLRDMVGRLQLELAQCQAARQAKEDELTRAREDELRCGVWPSQAPAQWITTACRLVASSRFFQV